MSDIVPYDSNYRKEGESHANALERRIRESAEARVEINVFYTEHAGSDPVTIEAIAKALEVNMPFGLKCQRSSVVFIPHKLKAYWVWGDGEHGPVFNYNDRLDLINGVKMQYLAHKELIPTHELVALSKIVLFENAIENVKNWEHAKNNLSLIQPSDHESGADQE